MLSWDSMAEREKRWGRFFLADPEWARGGRQDGEGWSTRREHQQSVAGTNRVFPSVK